MFHGYTFNTLRIQLSRALLLLDILIFVKIIKEITYVLHFGMQVPKALVSVKLGPKSINSKISH